MALERATLYGIVIYSNRRVAYSQVDPAAAREIFIREALVAGDWDTPLPFAAANRRTIAQVEELEHKARRQDVLVDDELIYAYYDQQLPAGVCSGRSLERWYRDEAKRRPRLLKDKFVALTKTLHQRPRSRLVPLPEFAEAMNASAEFGQAGLLAHRIQ